MFGDCSLLCSVRSFYSARQSRHSRFARSHFVLLIESALCRIQPTARVAIALLRGERRATRSAVVRCRKTCAATVRAARAADLQRRGDASDA